MDITVPYRTALRKATALVRSPYSVWKKMPVLEQHELFFFIFDQKIVYSKIEGYRTAEMPTAARLFEDLAAVDSASVDSIGAQFELTPQKVSLRPFEKFELVRRGDKHRPTRSSHISRDYEISQVHPGVDPATSLTLLDWVELDN
jgi:hypothetical protein